MMNLIDQYQNFIKDNIKKSFHYRGDVMNYRFFGQGDKVIVLLLGTSMFSSEAYFKLQMELSRYARILSVEDVSMKASVDRMTDCLSYLIRFLGFKKVTLLGIGYGGGLVQAFARDHASQTSDIILYNTLTNSKHAEEPIKETVEGVLNTIKELKELRKMMPLNTIKMALLEQIEPMTKNDDEYDLFQLLLSKYTDAQERQSMDFIKDLLTNYTFDKSDFKYLNYKSLIFYGYDGDPLGGGEFIEALVDLMTNPILKFLESDRYQLIIEPQPMIDNILEFLSLNK